MCLQADAMALQASRCSQGICRVTNEALLVFALDWAAFAGMKASLILSLIA
jgi:hypothetical protein